MRNMKPILLFLAVAALLASPTLGQAKKYKTIPANTHCPPGLAKNNPPCIPPGLAKHSLLPEDYRRDSDWLTDPLAFGLPRLRPGEGYLRIGDIFIKVDRETYEILNLFDAVGRVLDTTR